MGNSAGRSSGHPTAEAARRRAFPSERVYEEPPRDQLVPAFPRGFLDRNEWIGGITMTVVWIAGIVLSFVYESPLPLITVQNIVIIGMTAAYMWRRDVRHTYPRSARRGAGRPAKSHRRV